MKRGVSWYIELARKHQGTQLLILILITLAGAIVNYHTGSPWSYYLAGLGFLSLILWVVVWFVAGVINAKKDRKND